MKLISTYTPSHRDLKDRWFLPSIVDDYELCIHEANIGGNGSYMEADWSRAVEFKSQIIIQTIKDNLGDCFIYSDVDVEFFSSTKGAILQALRERDIACLMDDPEGLYCTGFFAIRATRQTLRLWEDVYRAVQSERRDQLAFNRIILGMDGVRHGLLPTRFFGPATFKRKRWEMGERLYIPLSPYLFHANWTIGIRHKLELLRQVKKITARGRPGVLANNLLYLLGCKRPYRSHLNNALAANRAGRLIKACDSVKPSRVTLDASTVCQLKCRTCPTSLGVIRNKFDAGFLAFADFKKFVADHPWISEIELSNWGEVFLNPDLVSIMEHAHHQHIILTINNGANLNTVTEEVLEALVRFRAQSLSCSIDGASQETYSQYRVNGDYDRVIANIKTINDFKIRHQSLFPKLAWQFVVFGHNEHEIETARVKARELNMRFDLKLSWDDLYDESFSPVRDRDLIRSQSSLKVADRLEYEKKYGRSYIEDSCHQLWINPRINFDGRLLGCSINHWGDYGNVFEMGLEACLTGEMMTAARKLLMGMGKDRDDIPCLNCKVYQGRMQRRSFVEPDNLHER
ncbi:MAG: putative nucleotide-diphospho-sugar transferase [bacterium]